MDKEKKYWNEQIKLYNSLPYDRSIRYYEWQPARWAGNYSAINSFSDILKTINSSIEIGAGSAAFSIALHNKNSKIKITALDISPIATKYGKMISNDLNIPLTYITEDLFKWNGKYF